MQPAAVGLTRRQGETVPNGWPDVRTAADGDSTAVQSPDVQRVSSGTMGRLQLKEMGALGMPPSEPSTQLLLAVTVRNHERQKRLTTGKQRRGRSKTNHWGPPRFYGLITNETKSSGHDGRGGGEHRVVAAHLEVHEGGAPLNL